MLTFEPPIIDSGKAFILILVSRLARLLDEIAHQTTRLVLYVLDYERSFLLIT